MIAVARARGNVRLLRLGGILDAYDGRGVTGCGIWLDFTALGAVCNGWVFQVSFVYHGHLLSLFLVRIWSVCSSLSFTLNSFASLTGLIAHIQATRGRYWGGEGRSAVEAA